MEYLTLLRVAMVIVAALNIGGMLSIGLIHWRAWRLLPAKAGLLPLHVFLVSLAVSGLQSTLAWSQLIMLTDVTPASPDPGVIARLVMYFLSSLVLMAALGVMANLQYRRVTVGKATEPVEVVSKTGKTVATIRVDGDTGTPPGGTPDV